MRIISTDTSPDGKEIHSTVSLASGDTLDMVIRRTSAWMCTISPDYEDMADDIDEDEYEALDSLTGAFSDILMIEDWIEEES